VHDGDGPSFLLIAVGAYQLTEALRASDRLERERSVHVSFVSSSRAAFAFPGRERGEARASAELRDRLFPPSASRCFSPICRPSRCSASFARSMRAGKDLPLATSITAHAHLPGMLFANRCTWAQRAPRGGRDAGAAGGRLRASRGARVACFETWAMPTAGVARSPKRRSRTRIRRPRSRFPSASCKIPWMARLVLVRHGQSLWNLENRFTGWVDVPLTDKGREEARQPASGFADIHFDVAYTSVLSRAQETST